MLTIRCTVEPLACLEPEVFGEPVRSTNRLGDWYAKLVDQRWNAGHLRANAFYSQRWVLNDLAFFAKG